MPDDAPSLRNAWPVLTAAALALLGLLAAVLLGGTEGREPVLRTGFALDLDEPWPLRGDPSLLEDGALDGLPSDWARAEPLLAHEVEGDLEVVLLDGQRRRWAVARQDGDRQDGDWQVVEHGLAGETGVLAALLPGDRVLAVADPRVERFDLVPDSGELSYASRLEEVDDGAAQGPPGTDSALVAVGLVGPDIVVQGEVLEPGDG